MVMSVTQLESPPPGGLIAALFPRAHQALVKNEGDPLSVTWGVQNTSNTVKDAVMNLVNLSKGGLIIAASALVSISPGTSVVLAIPSFNLAIGSNWASGPNNLRIDLREIAGGTIGQSHTATVTVNAVVGGGLVAVGDPIIT